MDFEYGLIEIIVVANPPPKMNFFCPQSYLLDRMERGLITNKDQIKTVTPIKTDTVETNENSFLSKMIALIKYIKA